MLLEGTGRKKENRAQAEAIWYDEHHIAKHRGAIRERWILKHLRAYFDTFLLTEITPARWSAYETERRRAG